MLLSKTATVRWNAKTKKHYTDLGYEFTHMGDSFVVNVLDLTRGSLAVVRVRCDYCNREYEITYHAYVNRYVGIVDKDCCSDCKNKKASDVFLEKYGVTNASDIPGAKEKQAATNLKRYGSENPFGSDAIKQKIIEINIDRYGVASPIKTMEVQEKIKKTCLEKYGVEHFMKLQEYRERFSGENSPVWKSDKSNESRERDRSCEKYRNWRYAVFSRDGFRCRKCGSRGEHKFGVQAHHIKNWSTNEDERYDINNGITLCKKCHDEFHKKYGKHNNSQEQINEFLNQGKKVC